MLDVDASTSKPRVYVHAEGDTPLADAGRFLYDDHVQYVLFKVLGVDERGAVTSTRCKLLMASWIGPTVPRMKKTSSMATKKAVSDYFVGAWRQLAEGAGHTHAAAVSAPTRNPPLSLCLPPLAVAAGHHLSIDLADRGGLDEKDIEARLRAAGGAHQPSRMQFSAGSKAEIVHAVGDSSSGSAHAPAPAVEQHAASPVKTAPAPSPAPAAAAVASPAPSSTSSSSSFGSAAKSPAPSGSVGANAARARAEAQEAAVAVGKAAAALSELVKAHPGGSVPAAEVAAWIDGLGGASTKLLSVVGMLA